jgi:Rad52/22 family double-strand break repair protein
MTYFTDDQITLLLKPIHPNRVLQLKGMSYLEGFDVRAELSRIFGFGRWSEETLDQQLVCETETKTNAGKTAWYVVYRTRIRLSIFAPDGTRVTHYDGAHVGESTHPVRGEAHGNALTNSQTYALRRCAINLGDQFGLGLYNKGSLDPIVRWTLVRPSQGAEINRTDTNDIPLVSKEEPDFKDAEEVSRPSAEEQSPRPVKSRGKTIKSVEDQIRDATTLEELREAWKLAGNSGRLQEDIVLSTGEKLTIQSWLYQRSDELLAKSSPAGSEGDPGTPAGDQ